MIEKINFSNSTIVDAVCAHKINEVVDVVNALVGENNIHERQIDELQMKIDDSHSLSNNHPYESKALEGSDHPVVIDRFEEQRKWIGKLCRFWDDDAFSTSKFWAFGILTSIDKGMQYQYCCNEGYNFKHCEPVKTDEDIIYKGE